MTASELKTRFLIGYEFIANNLAPGYTDDEISGFLNQGMHLLVDEFFGKRDLANIAEIIVSQYYTLEPAVAGFNPEDYGECSYWTARTSDFTEFRWFINSRAQIKRTEPFPVNTEWVECNLIDKTEADKWTQTSINKPIIVYPKLIFHGASYGFVVLIDSYSTIYNFQLAYVRTPTPIDVSGSPTVAPELNARLHQKIVDKAIALAMKATDVQRAQAEIQTNAAL